VFIIELVKHSICRLTSWPTVKIQHAAKDIDRNYLNETDKGGVFANIWDGKK